MNQEPLWTWSATALVEAMARRELTPPEVVDACIERLQAVNPALNAVVATRFDDARREAAEAEARLARGERAPLLGVPCTIKEFLAVRGMPNTGGIWARRAVVADRDATVVQRLKRAGAIVLGVTNAPEGGLWHETNNPVHGRTRNPHDLARTPGGSSGGEGAILAAGGVPFGVGSDTGGSVRIPAGFCGVVAHKPTGGLVPSTGHFPHDPAGPDTPMAIGPMARHVDDLWRVLQVMAGPDGLDPRCTRSLAGDPDEVDWSTIEVIALPSNGTTRPRPEIAASVHAACQALEARGARRVPWTGPDLSGAFELWSALLTASGERYARLVGTVQQSPRPYREALRWLSGRANHSGGVIAILLVEALIGRLPGLAERAAEARALRTTFDRALGPNRVLIHPVYPRTAPRHRAIALRDPRDVGCTALFNVTESPVTVVRTGSDRKGLPIGVQLVGARGRDALTLAAGKALEAVFSIPVPVEVRAR